MSHAQNSFWTSLFSITASLGLIMLLASFINVSAGGGPQPTPAPASVESASAAPVAAIPVVPPTAAPTPVEPAATVAVVEPVIEEPVPLDDSEPLAETTTAEPPVATVEPEPAAVPAEPIPEPIDVAIKSPGTSAIPVDATPALDPAVVANGKAKFGMFCVACHGAEGVAGDSPSNLYDGVWHRAEGSPESIRQVIVEGYQAEGALMPPWGPMLPAEDIDAMVSYLLTFDQS